VLERVRRAGCSDLRAPDPVKIREVDRSAVGAFVEGGAAVRPESAGSSAYSRASSQNVSAGDGAGEVGRRKVRSNSTRSRAAGVVVASQDRAPWRNIGICPAATSTTRTRRGWTARTSTSPSSFGQSSQPPPNAFCPRASGWSTVIRRRAVRMIPSARRSRSARTTASREAPTIIARSSWLNGSEIVT
jgi:hypothetical protein